MRRKLRVLLAMLVVTAALGAGVVAVGLATAPAFIAGAMSQLLDRHVAIGTIGVRTGWSLQVDLADVRVHESADPESPVVLEAERALGTQAWPRVLLGQLVPLRWVVERPTLRLVVRGGELPELDVPSVDLQVSRGRLELSTPRGEYVLEDLELQAASGVLLPTLEGELRAELRRGASTIGRVDARFTRGMQGARVSGALTDLDLARAGLPESLELGGRGRLAFELELDARELGGSLELTTEQFAMRVPGVGARIAPERAELSLSGRWRAGNLEVELAPLALDDLVLRGPLQLEMGGSGRLAFSLGMDVFEVGERSEGRVNALSLLGARYANLARIFAAIEGRGLDGRVVADLPLDAFGALLTFRQPLTPQQLELYVRAADASFDPGKGPPFEQISGEISIRGDELAFRKLRMTRAGAALPEIEVVIDGLSRFIQLPPEERRVPPGPGVPTPGLAAAFGALVSPDPGRAGRGGRAAGAPPPLRLSEFRIEHPALLFPIRGASAELSFPRSGVVAEGIRGIVAGGMADARIAWDRDQNRVSARVQYDYEAAGTEPPAAPLAPGRWASGALALDRMQLGPWPLESVSGQLWARGARLGIENITGATTGGVFESSARLELEQESGAPIDLSIDLRSTDLVRVARVLSVGEGRVTGRGSARGNLRGVLDPERPFLLGAEGELELELVDGTLSELPDTLQLARLPSLQGVFGLFGRAMPYTSVRGVLLLEQGVLRTERIALLGPELRILTAGEVDLGDDARATDLVVALLFVQTLDRVIEKLPLIGSWVLGKDESLFAIYVRLQGPWEDTRVSLVPPNALGAAAGWAGRTLGRAMRGLRDLTDWVVPGQSSSAPSEPEASAEPE